MRLSNRLINLREYFFSELAKKVKKVEEKTGRKVLNFGIGTPDFPPSKIYLKKLKEFFDESDSHLYPGYGAIPELDKALKFWYKKRFGVDLNSNELFPIWGGKDGISHLVFAIFDEGDEVLVPDPGYPAFSGPLNLVGAKAVYYNVSKDIIVDFNELEQKVSNKTKAIWVNFPSNPSGLVADLDLLKKFVKFAKSHGIWLLYDNAYSEITFDGFIAPSILQAEKAKDVAIEIGSASKTFSFAGYRIGWIVGNEGLINALAKVKSQIDSGITKPFQKLLAFALINFDLEWYKSMIKSYKTRRDKIAEKLKNLGLSFELSKGSLYIWARIPDRYESSEDFSQEILETKQVLFTPGMGFGENGKKFVRVSFCVNIDKIDDYL